MNLEKSDKVYPPLLQAGDEIRVIAPSRSMTVLNQTIIDFAIKRLNKMGFRVTLGKNVFHTLPYYNCASVEDRIQDLHEAFADKSVKAILTVVGGYNSNQLLPYIDYDFIRKHPKIFCGLSDITALQNAIYQCSGLVTFSGPHFSNFGMFHGFEYTEDYFKLMFCSDKDCIVINASEQYSSDQWFLTQESRCFNPNEGHIVLNYGKAEGCIVGGNLCTFNLLQGTKFMPTLEDKILFLEDTANLNLNYMLEFDRNFESLLQQDGFKNVKGIVIGRSENDAKMTIEKWKMLIESKKILKNIPVIINADIGHTTPIFTFPIGGRCVLEANHDSCRIELYKYE